MPGPYSDIMQQSMREHAQYLLSLGYTSEQVAASMLGTTERPGRWADAPPSAVARGVAEAEAAARRLGAWRFQGRDTELADRVFTIDPTQASGFRFVMRVTCTDPITGREEVRMAVCEADARPTRGQVEQCGVDFIKDKSGDIRYGRLPEIAGQQGACKVEVVSATRGE